MTAATTGRKTKKRSEDPRLSEVARHIVKPAGTVRESGGIVTDFTAIRKRCARFGKKFDRWQDGLGILTFAKREDGLYAAGIGGAVASIARQVGKTYLYGWSIFALCSLRPGLTAIWTAHRTRTADETFEKMKAMATTGKAAAWVDKTPSAHGEQAIVFKNGSRILFGARESGFGRGFDEVDILVLDECQILTENAMTDMVPATLAAPNGLVIMIGTPPRPKDPGEVFTNRRSEALDGDQDTLYVEISADKNANVDDRKQWRRANPAFLIGRVTEAAILRVKKLVGSDENFRREGLGVWDEEATTIKALDAEKWKATEVSEDSTPEQGRKVFGVKFSADGSAVALAVGIKPPKQPVHVEGIRVESLGRGTDWLVDYLAERADTTSQIVIDGRSGTGVLISDLADAGVRSKRLIWTPSLQQVIDAHTRFKQAVDTKKITHIDQKPLDDEVTDAIKRPIGAAGGFGWKPHKGSSVVLLEAVTLAFWGARETKRNPAAQPGQSRRGSKGRTTTARSTGRQQRGGRGRSTSRSRVR